MLYSRIQPVSEQPAVQKMLDDLSLGEYKGRWEDEQGRMFDWYTLYGEGTDMQDGEPDTEDKDVVGEVTHVAMLGFVYTASGMTRVYSELDVEVVRRASDGSLWISVEEETKRLR